MNKVYKVIWNHATRTWVAASEIARSKGKTKSVKTAKTALAAAVAVAAATAGTSAHAATVIGSAGYSTGGGDRVSGTTKALIGNAANPTATWANRALVIGENAKVINSNAVVIGTNATAAQISNDQNLDQGLVVIGTDALIRNVSGGSSRGSSAIGSNSVAGLLTDEVATTETAVIEGAANAPISLTNADYATRSGDAATQNAVGVLYRAGITDAAGVQVTDKLESNEATAIGFDSRAIGDQSIAIGAQSIAGHASVAIGGNDTNRVTNAARTIYKDQTGQTWDDKYETTYAKDGSVAIGVKSFSNSSLGTALGTQAQVHSNSTLGTAIGSGARVGTTTGTPTFSGVAIGAGSVAETGNTTAVGTASNALAENATSLGFKAKANGTNATAVGSNAIAAAADALAYGANATAYAANAVAIGTNATVTSTGESSIAFGTDTTVSGAKTVALGSNIKNVSTSGSVVLGDSSSAVTGAGAGAPHAVETVKEVTIGSGAATLTYSGFKGQVTDAGQYLSIGSVDAERQIKNLAAGNISSTSTDAINGSQLYAALDVLGSQIGNVYFHTNNITNAGTGDSATNLGGIGQAAGATGDYAVTAGVNATSPSIAGVAIGHGAQVEKSSKGTGSGIAIGTNTFARDGSVVIGQEAKIIGATGPTGAPGAVVVGKGATVEQDRGGHSTAIAIGHNAYAMASQTTGRGTDRLGNEVIVGVGTSIGDSAVAGMSSVAFGQLAKAEKSNAAALGTTALASADYASAVGFASKATGDQSVAVGYNATAAKFMDTVIGPMSSATGGNSVAVGPGAHATAGTAIAIGSASNANSTASIAMGCQTKAFATNATAIGHAATAADVAATAVGVAARSFGDSSFAASRLSRAHGDSSNAVGFRAFALGTNSTAIGTNATASTGNSIAIGSGAVSGQATADLTRLNAAHATLAQQYNTANDPAIIAAQKAIIAEEEAKLAAANAQNTIAIGNLAQATHADAVALGSGSTTTTANPTTEGTVAGVTYGTFAGTTPTSVVSVGSAGKERQIVNVAAGRISETSTDAINGSQLYFAYKQAATPLTITANTNADTDAELLEKQYAAGDGTQQQLGETLAIIGAKTNKTLAENTDEAVDSTYSAKNIQTVVTNNQVQIQIAEKPEFKEIKVKADDADNNPVVISSGAGDTGGTISNLTTVIQPPVGATETTAKPTTGLTNAATLGDVLNAGWNLKENGTAKDVVTPYDTVNFVNGNGTTVTVTPSNNGASNEIKVDINLADPNLTTTVGDNKLADDTAGKDGKVEAPTTGGDKLVNATTVANAINASGFTLKSSATADGTKDAASTGEEIINPGDVIEMVAGKNMTVKQDANGKITYSTEENVDFDTVTISNGTTVPSVKLVNEAPIAANNNPVAPTSSLNITNTDGKPTQLTGVGSVLNTVATPNSTGTQGSDPNKTPETVGNVNLVDLGTGTSTTTLPDNVLNSAATVRDLANMGWVVSTPNNNFTQAVKNANQVNFIGEGGVDVQGALNATTGIYDVTLKLSPAGSLVLDDINSATPVPGTTNPSGTVEVKDNPAGFVGAQNIANMINGAGWNLLNNDEHKDLVNPGNKVNFVDGLGTLVTIASDGTESIVQVDVDFGDMTNNANGTINGPVSAEDAVKLRKDVTDAQEALRLADEALAADPTNQTLIDAVTAAEQKLLDADNAANDAGLYQVATTQNVAEMINAAGWNVTSGADGGVTTGTTEELVNPGETVKFIAGDNMVLVQDGNNFTYSVSPDPVFNSTKVGGTYTDEQGNVIKNAPITIGTTPEGKNVISNLDNHLPDTNSVGAAPEVTAPLTAQEAADLAATAGNNAATLGDVLNAGWNLKTADKDDLDFVKPYDTVEFVNGMGTTIKSETDGVVSKIQVDVNLADPDLTTTVGDKTLTDGTAGTDGKIDTPATADGNKLVNATTVVEAINASGWTATSGKADSGINDVTDSELVTPGDTVTFVAGDNMVLTQVDGVFTYSVNPNPVFTTTTVGGSKVNDVLTNPITIGTTVQNINGVDTPVNAINNLTTVIQPPVGATETTAKPTTGLTNAATLGDVLNAGWNLKENGTAKDVVTPYDTVNFVNGTGTTVTVTPSADGTSNDVKVDVNLTDANIIGDITNNTNGTTSVGNNKDGDKLANISTVVDAINDSGFTLTSSANGGKKVSGTDEVINPGDVIDMAAGKNMTVKQDAKGKITYATAEDVDFNSVTLSNGSEPSVKLVNEAAVPATNNDAANAPTTALNITATDGKPTQITGVGSVLNTTPVATNVNTGGTATPGTSPLVNLGTADKPLAGNILNSAATVRDLANMGWVVSTETGGYKDTVKNANEVKFIAGSDRVSVTGETNATSGVREITIDLADVKAGEVTDPTTPPAAGDINFADTATTDVTVNPNTGVITVDAKTTTLEPKADGSITEPADATEGAKLVNATTVANAINNSGWNAKSGGNKADGDMADATLINPSEEVTFTAGKNLTVKRVNNEFTFATADDVDFNSVTVGNEGDKITIGNVGGKNVVGNLDTTIAAPTTSNNPADKPTGTQLTNAATLGDVLNAGWNLKENGTAKDVVTPYDTVNFINGNGTTVTVKPSTDGTSNDVKVDVKVDDKTIKVNQTTGALEAVQPVTQVNGNNVTGPVNLVDGDTTTVTNVPGKGIKVEVKTGDSSALPSGQATAITDKQGNPVVKVVDRATGAVTYTDTKGNPVAAADVIDSSATVATVGDIVDTINKTGWNITSDKTGTGKKGANDKPTVELINPSETVTFLAGDNMVLEQVGNNFTYSVSPTPVFTNVTAKEGITLGNPANVDAKGNPVGPVVEMKPVTASTPVDADGTKHAPVNAVDMGGATFTDLAPNLPATTSDTNGPTKAQPRPEVTKAEETNAATLGDVLNAGWNLQGNGEAKDFVKPYDTVNFVNGTGTTAVVTSDGNVSNVAFNVNVDDKTIKVGTDGKLYAVASKPTVTSGGKGDINFANTTTTNVTVDPNTGDIKVDVVTTPLTNTADGKVNTPANPNAVATAGDVAKAINNSGWKLAAEGTTGTELVKPSETVTFKAGHNMEVQRDGANITYATKKDVSFDNVKVGPVTINKDAGINAGNTQITGVKAGEADTDAVNVAQLKAAQTTVGSADGSVSVKETVSPTSGQRHYDLSVNLDSAVLKPINDRIGALEDDMSAGLAGSAAMVNIPQVTRPGANLLGVGLGHHKGESAVAVGFSSASDNERLIFKMTGTANTQGDFTIGTGMGWQW